MPEVVREPDGRRIRSFQEAHQPARTEERPDAPERGDLVVRMMDGHSGPRQIAATEAREVLVEVEPASLDPALVPEPRRAGLGAFEHGR